MYYTLFWLLVLVVLINAFNDSTPTAEEIAVAIREDAEKMERERHERSMV